MKVTVGPDIQLACQVCEHDDFEELPKVLLNTPGMTFAGLDWLNRAARCFVCARCGYVHWFVPNGDR